MPEKEKEYKEFFCLITILDENNISIKRTDEIRDPPMAEIALPYETETEIYGITCYVTNFPNFMPILGPTLFLMQHIEKIYTILKKGDPTK